LIISCFADNKQLTNCLLKLFKTVKQLKTIKVENCNETLFRRLVRLQHEEICTSIVGK